MLIPCAHAAASVKDLEKETQGHALRSHSPAPSHTSLSKIGTDPSMILISSATCPQFAAKAISGLRSTMEDCFAIVPDIAAIPRHWLVDLKLHQGPTSAEGRPGSAASASSYISKNSTSELDSPSTSSTSHGPRQHPSPISFPPQAASSGAASNMNSSHIASAHDHPPSTSHSSHKISQPKVVSSELPPQVYLGS